MPLKKDIQKGFVLPKESMQGKPCSDGDTPKAGIVEQQGQTNQDHEQVPVLPAELLNIILSSTGSQAAVLAAGPAGMKTWSDENIAEWLLHKHAGSSVQASDMTNALMTAVKHRLDEPARLLLSKAEPPYVTNSWHTLITAAARHVCVLIVTKILQLLQQAPDNNRKSQAWMACRTAMSTACTSGQAHVVKALLDGSSPYACQPNEEGSSCLISAVCHGHVEVVKELLNPARERCARANEQNSKALMLAASKGHDDVLLELLDTSREHHANANDNNCRALVIAAQSGQLNCLRVLLDTTRPSWAPANANYDQALMEAAQAGHLHIVHELLDTSRPNHTRADAMNSSALLYAVRGGHPEVLKSFLWQEHNPADLFGLGALQAVSAAVRRGDLECCRLLVGYPVIYLYGFPRMILSKQLQQGTSRFSLTTGSKQKIPLS